ncbi:hypothetical protein JNK13_00740 [bacterium]|nr:hypothetical protein [bacterium]
MNFGALLVLALVSVGCDFLPVIFSKAINDSRTPDFISKMLAMIAPYPWQLAIFTLVFTLCVFSTDRARKSFDLDAAIKVALGTTLFSWGFAVIMGFVLTLMPVPGIVLQLLGITVTLGFFCLILDEQLLLDLGGVQILFVIIAAISSLIPDYLGTEFGALRGYFYSAAGIALSLILCFGETHVKVETLDGRPRVHRAPVRAYSS